MKLVTRRAVSLRIVIITLTLMSFHGALAKIQLHPSFKTRPVSEAATDYLIGTVNKPWSPSMPTTLVYTGNNATVHMSVEVLILPGTSVQLAIHHRCSNSGSKQLHRDELDVNAKKSAIKICQNFLPIEIKVANHLQNPRSVKIDLQAKQNKASKMTIDEALTHYVLIKVEIFGIGWSLMSNGLFLRGWDTNFITQQVGPLITTDGTDLLSSLGQSLPIPISFIKVPFIENKAVELIKKAPQFIQSIISIGAFAVFNSYSCEQEPSKSIALMSKNYMDHRQYISSSAFRISASTGQIHYSRHGLSKAAHAVIRYAMYTGPAICHIPLTYCTVFRYCSRLENSHLNWKKHFEPIDELSSVNISNHAYLSVPEASQKGRGECQVEQMVDTRIKIFTNTRSQVLCPIICSRPDEPYEFFQGAKKLLPLGRDEFTRYGGVSVHKSGMMIWFESSASHADSGEYSCTAGGQIVRLRVDIVSLPLFSIPNTKLIRGRMQEKIYPMENDGYSVNCTVFYSDMKSVTVTPEFYVMQQRSGKVWTKMSLDEFKKHLAKYGSNCKVSLKSDTFSAMLVLTVDKVPAPTDDFDFSHRFVCSATVSDEDNKRFGLPEYGVQSGTDILVPPVPVDSDFRTQLGPCCLTPCSGGGSCFVDYSISAKLFMHVKSMGLEVRGSARTSTEWIPDDQIEYNSQTGNLRVRVDQPFGQADSNGVQQFSTPIPVYSYHDRDNHFGFSKVIIIRYSNSRLMGAARCHVDITCLYSTDFDLSLSFTAGEEAKNVTKVEEEPFNFQENVKSLLESVSKDASSEVERPTAALFLLTILTNLFLLSIQ